jgi:hypothetical protein
MSKQGSYLAVALAGLLWGGLFLAGCQGAKTVDNFRKVKMGWTQEQVHELLGEPDQVQEAAGLAGVWQYQGKNWFGSHDSTLIVTLLGGRVVMVTMSSPVPR